MHTAWKARCKVKEAFPAIYNSLNNEIELLVETEIVHHTRWEETYKGFENTSIINLT